MSELPTLETAKHRSVLALKRTTRALTTLIKQSAHRGRSWERERRRPNPKVELICPETGEVYATEHDRPLKATMGVSGRLPIVASFRCDECHAAHSVYWPTDVPLLRVER